MYYIYCHWHFEGKGFGSGFGGKNEHVQWLDMKYVIFATRHWFEMCTQPPVDAIEV